DLGADRSPSAARRPDDPGRAERGGVAGAARARSLARAEAAERAWPAVAGAADRAFRAWFRGSARRAAGAGDPRAARRALADRRLALLAAARGADRRRHPRAQAARMGAGDRSPGRRVRPG